ncbi:MAG TPA: TetR/AcrR family transcriptional regulator [Acidimicrobiales bacterium]|nr:TetR/AcrR family transcriptional regulator [Acidimicrobiales bacterium]
MPPSERRAAIIEATVPLVRGRGWAVTTKEIAAAAGVSDGTIFSVFRDKEEILLAALEAALDPRPALGRLGQIDLGLPLEERLTQAVKILGEMVMTVWQLSGTLHLDEVRGRISQQVPHDYLAQEVLGGVLEPSRDELVVEPVVAGRALLALIGGSNPALFKEPLSVEEIVTLILDGIRKNEAPPSPTPKSTRTRGG